MNRQHHTRHLALSLAMAAVLTAPLAAGAGMLDNWFKKGGGERPPSARYDLEPTLTFDGGQLTIDISGHWKLGGSSLSFTEESVIYEGVRETSPRDLHMGQEARVMGYRLADGTVAVRRLTLVLAGRQQVTSLATLEGPSRDVGTAPRGGPR